MASYTDNIPTFNPYVQTLPVDEMVKVGMYKQQKYDEGIQKIQTNIDNIAGLDVVRDVDKAYIQSKLNQLGNNLTTVAAGDFSNFQLVNSVNGMTNQITKDNNVLNAISSAKTYRKGLEDMAAANKDGKGSASHDWLFKTEASKWLNSQDINQTFNGGYKQYSNYQKNAQEVIKGLVKNETGRDVAFEYDKNGNMIVLDAMTRTEISGITPERIQSALMVGLSPNDWQSMQIDGRYSYANSTPEQFVNDLNKSYTSDYDKLKSQRDILVNAMDSPNKAADKIKIQQQIDSLDNSMKSIESEYQNVSKTFAQGDAESAKARYYSTKWVNNFSQTFASQNVNQKYIDSPFQQVKQFKETKAVEYKKWLADHNQRNAFHQDEQYWKSRDDQRADNKDKREQKEADAKDVANSGYGGLGFSVPQDELPEVTLGKVNQSIFTDQQAIDKADAALMESFDKKGNNQWLQQQQMLWEKNPGNVDAVIASHFKNTQNTRREVVANASMIVGINNELDKKYGKIENYIPAGSPNINVVYPNSKFTFTPKDFVEFNSVLNNYRTVNASEGGASAVVYDDEKARKELSQKQLILYNLDKKRNSLTPKPLSKAEETLLANQTHYRNVVNKPYEKVLKQRYAETSEIVKNRVVAMQGMEYGIPLSNEDQKSSFGNVLQRVADLADSQEGGLANSPGLNTETLRAIAPKIQNANIKIVEGTKWAPATYEITAANDDGTTQKFRLSAEQYREVFKGRYDPDPAIEAIRPYETQQIRVGGGTTALDGKKTNVGNSFLGNPLDFINVRHYPVSGNIVTDQLGMSSIRLNISDPITGKVIVEDLAYPRGGLIQKNKIAPAIQGLTDQAIFEMLYNRPPTAAELKQLQQ